ncbi:MAG TPA: amidase family protein [Pedomonas sp.]|uniref:amidase n=1 Tax=Pedomonas sp. TaxID=2976421 RepID=UPI002F42FCBD
MDLSRRDVLASATALAAAGMTASGMAAAAAKSSPLSLLSEHDALGLAELVRRKQVSAAELLEAAIARTEALNPKYNFLSQKHYERARAALAMGVPQGPFSGVPFLLKDLNTYLEGEVTGQGSRYWTGYRATVTSEIAKRYERAGLVIFGKTATPEFGLTGTTESLANGITRNPWNPERTAGGSSGGAAVAVAAGVIPVAHATDGGGSIRIPASCCGLFGLKPSRGRVPMGPPLTEGWGGLSAHHAVTRSVRDSAALLDATAGIEPGSRYGAPTPERPYLEEARREPGRLRIALAVSPPAGSPVDAECVEAARAAARLCESLGHHVEEASPKLDMEAIGRAVFSIISASVAANIQARQAATGIAPGPDVLEAVTLVYYQIGLKTTGIDFANANNVLQEAALTISRFMDSYDVLLTPTLATPPVEIGRLSLSNPNIEAYYQAAGTFTAFTGIFNMTGQPAMSVPLAMSRSGLPIGVQFAGRYGDEATLFRLAGQLEQAAPWAGRRPSIS